MDTPIFEALDEWTRLESAHHRAEAALPTVRAKALEILAMHPRTREGAFVHLRFCATFLEWDGAKACPASDAIRNAAGFLWSCPSMTAS